MAESDPDPNPNIFHLALACYRAPLAHPLRSDAPLPPDMTQLLRLANRSPAVLACATHQTGAKAKELQAAAQFLIQQLCFVRGASHYRVLGLEPSATAERLKEHHRLLMRLFHPDRTTNDKNWTDSLASRINEARTALLRSQSRTVWSGAQRSQSPSPVSPVVVTARSQIKSSTAIRFSVRRSPFRRFCARFTALRYWMLGLVLGGSVLVVEWVVWRIDEVKSRTTVAPVSAIPETPIARSKSASSVDATDSSAISILLVAPDWSLLDQHGQPVWSVDLPADKTQLPATGLDAKTPGGQ